MKHPPDPSAMLDDRDSVIAFEPTGAQIDARIMINSYDSCYGYYGSDIEAALQARSPANAGRVAVALGEWGTRRQNVLLLEMPNVFSSYQGR